MSLESIYKMGTMEELWENELTQDDVVGIFENHSQTAKEIALFFKQRGYRDMYMGSEVFIWLGY
tara:strand:- start:1460 stop:1651 length:192 start_codon:yes stop_codon:yes gene_type:complete